MASKGLIAEIPRGVLYPGDLVTKQIQKGEGVAQDDTLEMKFQKED